MIRCIHKMRDKNGVITSYVLMDTITGDRVTVDSNNLKFRIKTNKVKISNLQLTSDGRLIDYNDSTLVKAESGSKKKVFDGYFNGNNTTKINYAMSKMNSKRVGKLVTRALLVGLTCASLTSLTGCSSSQPLEVNATSQEQTVETLQDKINKLNEASKIDVDVHNFSLTSKATVSIDGQDIGVLEGKFIKLFDTLKFTDSNGDTIATGDQEAHLLFDCWTVYDSEGNALYRMKQELGITKKYIIMDTEDNEVGWLKAEFFTLSKSANIYDMDGNIIAEINQYPLRKDFIIEIKDNSKIDNTSLTTISVNYMMQAIKQSSKSHNSKSNNGD